MGTAKRERQKLGRQARIEAAVTAQQRSKRLRSVRNFGIILVAVVAVLFALAFFTGSDKKTNVAASGGSTTAPSSGPVQVTIPAAGASISGDTPCPNADGSSARTTKFAKAPPMCITAGKTYTAKVDTSKGSFTIALDPTAAPNTVNNFVVLARYHFYDGVAFHRIIPGFMDQTGDANGPTPGSGSPGYSFADELPTGATPYPDGAVAMANSGPNTNGSQFFVVVDQGGSQLSPNYSKFGRVTDGLDVAKAINQAGTAGQSGTPTQLITISSVTITES